LVYNIITDLHGAFEKLVEINSKSSIQ